MHLAGFQHLVADAAVYGKHDMSRIGGDDRVCASNDEASMSGEDNPFVKAYEAGNSGPAGLFMRNEVWNLMVPEHW